MDKKDFSDILNNMKDLTLRQMVSLVKKLKYRTVAAVVVFCMTLMGGAFAAGKYSQSKETAVMLHKPFAMRIELNGKIHDFDTLTLIKDPNSPVLDDDKVILSLREVKSAFDVIPVGRVVATVEENKLTGIWQVIISKSSISVIDKAHAQHKMSFDWRGHENDYDFKERFVAKHTVHRYYSDGCVLAYNVDSNRRSIPRSFRWIETTH